MPTLTLDSAPRDSQLGGSLLRKLAGAYRRSPGGMSQTLYNKTVGLPARMRRLLEKMCAFGGRDLARKIVAELKDAVDTVPPAPLTATLRLHAQQVDGEEEVAELAYGLDPSAANLERLARAKEKQGLTSLAEAESLRALQRSQERV